MRRVRVVLLVKAEVMCRDEDRKLLKRLGFSVDTWGEVVVVFLEEKGNSVISVMPLGLKLLENCSLSGRLFRGSRIYDYILNTGVRELKCKICISEDPLLFYAAVYEKKKVTKVFKKSLCPRSYCSVCLSGSCIFSLAREEDVITLELHVDRVVIRRALPKVFTRASAALIEALVWLTKVPYMSCEEVEKVVEWVELLKTSVYRSSQQKVFKELADEIFSKTIELVKNVEDSRCRPRDKNV